MNSIIFLESVSGIALLFVYMEQNAQPSKSQTGPEFYPLLLKPVYKDYIWGGTRIPALYHREPRQEISAESWEVSDRPEGMSVVTNGRHAGKSLQELVTTQNSALMGATVQSDVFPLLIKIIDARERLSVQVHPNERAAQRFGGEPKTEAWYVLDAEPGSKVYAGLARGTNRTGFERALRGQKLEDVLQPIPAEPGKTIFIPGGRVHAICEGCLLLEVQQNSNTTYRVYDWGRVGHDGRPRQLHTQQAFQCINWRDRAAPAVPPHRLRRGGANTWSELLKCPYFHLTRVDLTAPETIAHDGRTCSVMFIIDGQLIIEGNGVSETIHAGTSCLLPASLDQCRLTPVSNAASAIRISLV